MPESKVALITGAASGIGLAVTKDLLSKGWKVYLCDLRPPSGEDAAVGEGENASFKAVDVTDYDALAAVFAAVWSECNRLDFAFANAGISDNGTFGRLAAIPKSANPPPKPDLKALDVNLIGVIHTIYLAAYYMPQNPSSGGKIIATASAAGLYGLPYVPVYCASKYGVVGLVRSLASSLVRDNITINCLCPGLVATGLSAPVLSLLDPASFTPMSTVLTAVNRFLDGSETGCAAELSLDKIYMRAQPEFCDKAQESMTKSLGDAVINAAKAAAIKAAQSGQN